MSWLTETWASGEGSVPAESNLSKAAFALLGYRLWWALRTPFARTRSNMRSIVVIGGSPRSGTTLLRSILGRHPMICSGPETTVFLQRVSSSADIGERMGWTPSEIETWQRQSHSQMEFIETFARTAMQRAGKTVWVEKTPHNVWRFGFVRRRFPHAKLVHIIRDGRDVVCSLRKEPFSKVQNAAWNSPSAAQQCAAQWCVSVKAGLKFRGDQAYHELRYEELAREPEPVLRNLMVFLGLPWDASLLKTERLSGGDAHETKAAGNISDSSIGRWQYECSREDLAAIRMLTEPLLRTLGY